MKRLADRKALVTGASRGIGAAIRETGAKSVPIRADAGNGEAARSAVARAHEQLGGLDDQCRWRL